MHVLSLVLFGYTFSLYWLRASASSAGEPPDPVTARVFCSREEARPTSAIRVGTSSTGPACVAAGGVADAADALQLLPAPVVAGPAAARHVAASLAAAGPRGARRSRTRRVAASVAPRVAAGTEGLGVAAARAADRDAVAVAGDAVRLRRSLVFVGSLDGRRLSAPRLVRYLAWAAVLGLAARLLHGFLAPVAEPAQAKMAWHPFWGETSPGEWLRWHAEALGALLPIGVLGFFFLRTQRVLLGVLAAGGLLARDLFKYGTTWDIVKFSMVTQIALGILAAAAISAALSRRRWWVVGAGGLVACTFFGFAWAVALTFRHPGAPASRPCRRLPTWRRLTSCGSTSRRARACFAPSTRTPTRSAPGFRSRPGTGP